MAAGNEASTTAAQLGAAINSNKAFTFKQTGTGAK
jgi:hypothetical protein